ncbi:MAG: 4-hydroxy-3-methylbut-2-enyl diphosphate reductase [Deltaproteobacteria bacterium]|nr:4-hydroxy-3-methylbut-2-enyl diphosphate reductase [Deltaproteobacteria bacterium]
MEILVAKSAGFCFGVKRAINLAEKCAAGAEEEICTLGPIIHNPQAVKKLEESRIFVKKSIDDISGGTVIIRSHGIKSEEHDALKEKGLNVVDATCPFVKKAQELVSLLAKEGYSVIVAGEKEHPEVKGLISYGLKDIRVAEDPEDLSDMPRKKKIGIVAQTTLPMKKLEAIVSFCLRKASEVKVFNTICNATSIRQEESAELARKVDCMIVAGGRNSANTARLVDICRAIQPKTYHVEVASEIIPEWLSGVVSIGVTAGASTPDWIIKDVVEEIARMCVK